jgi:hypothetical protein
VPSGVDARDIDQGDLLPFKAAWCSVRSYRSGLLLTIYFELGPLTLEQAVSVQGLRPSGF